MEENKDIIAKKCESKKDLEEKSIKFIQLVEKLTPLQVVQIKERIADMYNTSILNNTKEKAI